MGLWGAAFYFGGTNNSYLDENIEGSKVYDNIVIGALLGVRLKAGYSDVNEVYTDVWNNTFIGCKYSLYLFSSAGHTPTGANFKNNISLSPTSHHIYAISNLDDIMLDSDYNIFYPDGAGKFTYDGVDSDSLAYWVLDNSIDSNSRAEDPLLTGAGTYDEDTDIQFPSNSPAKDNGTNVGLSADYFGTSIPQGGGYDIGAYEYVDEAPDVNVLIGVELSGVSLQ